MTDSTEVMVVGRSGRSVITTRLRIGNKIKTKMKTTSDHMLLRMERFSLGNVRDTETPEWGLVFCKKLTMSYR